MTTVWPETLKKGRFWRENKTAATAAATEAATAAATAAATTTATTTTINVNPNQPFCSVP